MARATFGTDGVRGRAGDAVGADLALDLGRAAAAAAPTARPRVLVLRDPRASGPMLEAALAAGLAAGGAHVLLGGVLPTPAAALLVRRLGLDLGAVVSASHNPWEDNGIKLFGPGGTKLDDEAEARVAAVLDDPTQAPAAATGAAIGTVEPLHGAEEDYLRALHERFSGLDLRGRRIAIDAAHGSGHRVGPEILRRLGAEVTAIGDAPDGVNVNAGVGSTHPEALKAVVADGGHDLGIALDGDADRVLLVDRTGAEVDGDELVALAALHLQREGTLGGGVAVTVMSNVGFHQAMEAAGIEVETTKVGDRHVIAALLRRGWRLGGEQSGHVIETGFVPSGDGIASALLALEALGGGDLADGRAMRKLPQVLENVRVADRERAASDPAIADAVAAATERLRGRGRVLLRPSGTEPLVRVMAEAPEAPEARAEVDRLVAVVRDRAG